MLIAPRSCSTSSAAIVSGRMRDSAKARSSGIFGLRWWQTMSMSRCSSMVFTVKGMVGLVEEGRQFGSPQTLRMSGAWPPPAPSVWYVWMVRPFMARIDSSTKPASFRVSVWMATCTSCRSATSSAQSMAAGVLPQSSWSFSPMAPATICSSSGSGRDVLPLPRKPRLTGMPSAASSMRCRPQLPGVQVVAFVPVAGPEPPPIRVVIPAESASNACCGQMKWMCESTPPR